MAAPPPVTSPVQALSLLRLPEQTFVVIAAFLNYESLYNLGTADSLTRQQLLPHWTVLHDARWSCGKLLRFPGLPSQWPRDGARATDETLNWREEFFRRYELDKSVPKRIAKLSEYESHDSPLSLRLRCDGADIWDKLTLLSCKGLPKRIAKLVEYEFLDSPHSLRSLRLRCDGADIKVKRAMKLINDAEAKAEWTAMATIHADSATFEDALMILFKYCQTHKSLVERKSSDEIYNVINRHLDGRRKCGVDSLVSDLVFELQDPNWQSSFLVTYLKWRSSGDPLWETAQIEWRRIITWKDGPLIFIEEAITRMSIWIDSQ
ncbi:hypothetical protein ACHAWF_010390 [Thalassiosira exigua]